MAIDILLKDERIIGGVTYAGGSLVSVTDALAQDMLGAGLATIPSPAVGPEEEAALENWGISASASPAANVYNMRRAVERGGLLRLNGPPGVYTLAGTVPLRSGTDLTLAPGIRLFRADNVNAPLFKNRYCPTLLPAASFSRAGNVATVQDTSHTNTPGDRVWISGGPDSSFRGLVVVRSATLHAWTYANPGSDDAAGGTSGEFFNVVPMRRTLAVGAFVRAASGLVTVADPAHDIKAGDQVYVAAGGADASLAGCVDVIKITSDSWSYVSSASSLTSSTVIGLCYDYDIAVRGGIIDGNRVGNSGGIAGAGMKNSATAWGAVNRLLLDSAIGGSSVRGSQFMNCVGVRLGPNWSTFDTLVGAQFEGGGRNLVVEQAVHGASHMHSVTAQKSDDYVAFTGVKNANGAPGHYDDTISPLGLTYFEGIDVRNVNPTNCLNGVKLTSHSDCPFRGTVRIGTIFGHTLDTAPLLVTGAAVKIVDDGPGLAGTTFDVLDIAEPGHWYGPETVMGEFLYLQGAGTINTLRWNAGHVKPQSQGAVAMSGMTIKQLVIRGLKNDALGSSRPVFNLSGGSIKALVLDCPHITVGTNQDYIYLNGTTIGTIVFRSPHVESVNAGVGGLVRWNAGTVAQIVIDTLTNGTNAFGSVLISDKTHGAASAVEIDITNSNFVSANLVTTPGAATAANLTCTVRGSNLKWAASGSGNLMQVGTGNWVVKLDKNCEIQTGRIALLSGFGTPAYRFDCPSVGIDMGATFGAPPATFSAPATGDMIINTNGTGGGLGVRTAAGAWALV